MQEPRCNFQNRCEAYLADELSEAEALRFEPHVETCPECKARLALLDDNDKVLSRLRTVSQETLKKGGLALNTLISPMTGIHLHNFVGIIKPTDDPLTIGEFEEYSIREVVAQGALGCVFRAFDRSREQEVTLKFVRPSLVQDEALRQRIIKEPITIASLDNPHIVKLWRPAEVGEWIYFALEQVGGRTLRERFSADAGDLPDWQTVRKIILGILDGIKAIHDADIIHRDLKPDNIVLTEKDLPKIIDFGVADLWSELMDQTGERHVTGTPGYMSPEQARGTKQLDKRSDLFSLGAVLFYIGTGKAPFSGSSTIDILGKNCNNQIAENVRWRYPLSDVAYNLLGSEPEQRYPNVERARDEIESIEHSATSVGTVLDTIFQSDPAIPEGPSVPVPSLETKKILERISEEDLWERLQELVNEAALAGGIQALSKFRNSAELKIIGGAPRHPETEADMLATTSIIQKMETYLPLVADEFGCGYAYLAENAPKRRPDRPLRDVREVPHSKIHPASQFGSLPENCFKVVIDGIDGSGNFRLGLNLWCVAVVLFVGDRPRISAIYWPTEDILFASRLGTKKDKDGTFAYDQDTYAVARGIRSGIEKDLRSGIEHNGSIAVHFVRAGGERDKLKAFLCPRGTEASGVFEVLHTHLGGSTAAWNCGLLQMAHVALGSFGAFVNPSSDFWSIPAGSVLLEACGGRVTNEWNQPLRYDGGRTPLIASRDHTFHQKICSCYQTGKFPESREGATSG